MGPVRLSADILWFALLTATVASVVLLRRELWTQRALRGALSLFVIALVAYGFVYYGNFRYRAPLRAADAAGLGAAPGPRLGPVPAPVIL